MLSSLRKCSVPCLRAVARRASLESDGLRYYRNVLWYYNSGNKGCLDVLLDV